ncbi:MAG: hypothetical protein GXP19_00975 [Gammaproteobacteria bacterium]|nr:hypothetical protein [Gammaproteobacteria bacterium]
MRVFSLPNVISILSAAFLITAIITPVYSIKASPIMLIQFAANASQQNNAQEQSPRGLPGKQGFDEFKIQREQVAAKASKQNNVQEQLLWDLLGEQRFDEFKIELEQAQDDLPNWPPPPKMMKIFHEGVAANARKQNNAQNRLLWDLLGKQRFDEFKIQLEQVQDELPGWRPPSKMMQIFHEGYATIHIKRATDNEDWVAIERLASQYPAHFNCSNVYNMWALALAQYKLEQTQNSVDSYQKIIKQCDANQTLVITLQRASLHLPEEQTEFLVNYYSELDSAGAKLHSNVKHEFDTLRYDLYTTWITKHADKEQFSTAINYFKKIENDIINRKDAKVSNVIGWTYFKIKQFDDASFWFDKSAQWLPSDEAQFGLALTSFEKKNLLLADFHLNKMKNRDHRSDSLIFEIQMIEASKAYSDGNYSDTLSVINNLDPTYHTDRRVSILRAWSLFQLKEYAEAEDQFISLYEAGADKEMAQGVFFSAFERNNFKQVKTLVARTDGPLDKMWRDHLAEKLYYQKKYEAAYQVKKSHVKESHVKKNEALTGKFSSLKNIDASRLGLGLKRTWRTGTDGLSQLKSDHMPFFEGYFSYNSGYWNSAHRFALKLERIKLDSGVLGDNALVGNYPAMPPQNYLFDPTNSLDAGIEPHLYYDFTDERYRYFAELGVTPTDGIVDSKLLWRAGILHSELEYTWDLTLFSTPVRESILSYTGIVDPYTGQEWGRVMETGLTLSGMYNVQPDWTLSSSINFGQYKGQTVDDNKHIGFSISANKIFTRYKRLDYLAIGPRLSVDQYDKNLGQFTIGHGGYFSPQKMTQVMLSAHTLSKESYQYVFEADIALGYISYDEDAVAFFPLNEDGRFYAKNSGSGFGMSIELEAAWRLHSHWYAIGRTSYLRGKKFEESDLLLGIRYIFDARPALFSTDLPSHVFHKK